MEILGRFLAGALLAAVAAWWIAGATFRLRHWRDWPTRWRDAHPAIALFLLLDLYQRTIFHDRAMPRTRLQALLWEAPLLLIGALMLLVGILLMLGLIGSS